MYAPADAIIQAWADKLGLRVCKEFGGREIRFAYVSGGEQECFQVSIALRQGGMVVVHATSIETIDDVELEATWTVPENLLAETLVLVSHTIEAWKNRQKGPATWSAPWR